MTKLERMIAELCPNGVEYKYLKDVLTIKNGSDYKHFPIGDVPVYGSGGIIARIDRAAFDRPSVLIPRKGSIDKLYYVEEPFWNVDTIFYTDINTDLVLPRYVYHYLKKEHLERLNTAGGVPSLTQAVLNKVEIPVPPLEIQQEIVRILDNFTELSAELAAKLEAEIAARKKQYEYYRDALLTFDATGETIFTDRQTDRQNISSLFQSTFGISFVRLGDIATITRGGNFQKKDFQSVGIPCIHYGQIYTKYGITATETISYIGDEAAQKSKMAMPDDIIMAVTSENVDDICKCVAWQGQEAVAVSGHTAIIHHNQNARYLSYYFHTSMFFEQKRRLAHGTKVIEVTPSHLNDVIIPLPPIEEQDRIVSILDRFDTLCHDLAAGLPAEIAARQKQYEYYRDKLLTFEEKI